MDQWYTPTPLFFPKDITVRVFLFLCFDQPKTAQLDLYIKPSEMNGPWVASSSLVPAVVLEQNRFRGWWESAESQLHSFLVAVLPCRLTWNPARSTAARTTGWPGGTRWKRVG